jgi:peptidoglycan/xylan/chitin deacetylase (PgdA/CDA1 family)
MLLILMYHRVYGVGLGADALRTHFAYLRAHHPIVLPGDRLPRRELSICLTFDDATVDFFHIVYPLLRELELKALVAVPTRYIVAASRRDMATRLQAQQRAAMSGDYAHSGDPLCTWDELRQMQASGHVRCASHSHSHANMADRQSNIAEELILSAQLLHTQLGTAPDTFVYPYGRATKQVQAEAMRHYRHTMRIGSAINRGWDANGGLLYRVDAEHFWPKGGHWSFGDAINFRLKYLANRLRRK